MSDADSRLLRLIRSGTVPLVFHTVKNMEVEQLAGIAERRLRHLVVPSLPVDTDGWYDRKVPGDLCVVPSAVRENTGIYRRCLTEVSRRRYRKRAAEANRGQVTFLNRSIDVGGSDGVTWFPPESSELPGLWALKFHGFEFLSWAVLGYDGPEECPEVVETVARWLEDWDEASETRIGTEAYLRRGWTPHAVSLRVLNLARLCAWCRDDRVERLSARLAYRNAAFLSNHVEYDVGGNHLIENGIALLMAGVFFEEDDWLRQGLNVLVDASDQFLDDGGHFERSPMYHAITLTRYLSAVDLLERSGRTVPEPIRGVVVSGRRFLEGLRPPDGKIPLLNDAVFGEGMALEAVSRYAEAVGISADGVGRHSLASSGYHWLGTESDCMLVDDGSTGPAHLPGHAHNDPFAVCFWADGRRVLTDTGTYEYAPTERRQHARSVAAHNTVQYGDIEPIPIGGSYLMGRRLEPSVRTGTVNGLRCFDGSYSRERGTDYDHRRRIFHGDEWWFVWDTVKAGAKAPITSRLHVAPDIDVDAADDDRLCFHVAESGDGAGTRLATLLPAGTERVAVSTSLYFPEFLQASTRPEITMVESGSSVGFGFLLSTGDHRAVTVDRDGIDATGLSIDSTYTRLPTLN